MALTNAERQARYIARLKAKADAATVNADMLAFYEIERREILQAFAESDAAEGHHAAAKFWTSLADLPADKRDDGEKSEKVTATLQGAAQTIIERAYGRKAQAIRKRAAKAA
jgi:hypothetical protein